MFRMKTKYDKVIFLNIENVMRCFFLKKVEAFYGFRNNSFTVYDFICLAKRGLVYKGILKILRIIFTWEDDIFFSDVPGNLGSILGRFMPKTLKMVFDTSWLNLQRYKLRIKGKVEQTGERSTALLYTSV